MWFSIKSVVRYFWDLWLAATRPVRLIVSLYSRGKYNCSTWLLGNNDLSFKLYNMAMVVCLFSYCGGFGFVWFWGLGGRVSQGLCVFQNKFPFLWLSGFTVQGVAGSKKRCVTYSVNLNWQNTRYVAKWVYMAMTK